MQALPLILAAIQAALAASSAAPEIVAACKNLVDALFTKKLISVEQQSALNGQVDAWAALVRAGIVPPAWQVQPDPA